MLYSKSCEYAFRALTYLAMHKDSPFVMAKEISSSEDIPHHFLSKLLQTMAKMGVVSSFKGPTGGFALAVPPETITLYDLMERIDHANIEENCAVGLYECSDTMPCPMHELWKPVRKMVLEYLTTTTIADLAQALQEKKRILGDLEDMAAGTKSKTKKAGRKSTPKAKTAKKGRQKK